MRTLPWLLLMAVVIAFLPFSRMAEEKGETEKEAQSRSGESGSEGQNKNQKPKQAELHQSEPCTPNQQTWCEPRAVLGDYLDRDLKTRKSEERGRVDPNPGSPELRFMIALVPDPIDSELPLLTDLALDGIQRGFANEGFQFDRFWLPWVTPEDQKAHLYRSAPGVLLFRKSEEVPVLEVVFVVGESPRSGVQRKSFRTALELIDELSPHARVDILGPTFSGSAESLAAALGKRSCNTGGICARIATDTATGERLEEYFPPEKAEFCRTVAPDTAVFEAGFGFLRSEMGWNLRRVSLLGEEDTQFGRDIISPSPGEEGEEIPDSRLTYVRFPIHISAVRNAWQGNGKERKDDTAVKVGGVRLQTGRPALDLNLGNTQKPTEIVPDFSPLTVAARDLELSNLLETLSREGIRYIGVVATDPEDRLFLFEKIRQFSPDTVLFTTDNNLLFAHPKLSESLDGLVVLSSAPLFTEGANWLPLSIGEGSERRYRRQFLGEFQEGIFAAVLHLLNAPHLSRPQVWVSVVGNGSLWPLARLDMPETTAKICANAPATNPEPLEAAEEHGVAPRTNLLVLFLAGLLCLLSVFLQRLGVLKHAQGRGRPVDQPLMLLGGILLVTAGACLFVVTALPEWLPYVDESQPFIWGGKVRMLFVAALVAAYGYLALQTVALIHGRSASRRVMLGLLTAALTLGIPVLLALLTQRLWMLGQDPGMFHLRARVLNSGLSPLVPLGLLGGSLYVWILCELQREWLVRKQTSKCPLRELLGETSSPGHDAALNAIERWVKPTLPRKIRYWLLAGAVFLPPWALLMLTVQPLGETRGYGRIFLSLLTIAAALAALSYFRFVQLWNGLYAILRRLDHALPQLGSTFDALSPEVDWKPMRSL